MRGWPGWPGRGNSLERVALVGFLHGLQNRLVDAETYGGREYGEGQVGHDTHNAELGEGEEQQQEAPEHNPRLLDVPPVQQVNSCERRHKAHST